jgi:hypothetical protein
MDHKEFSKRGGDTTKARYGKEFFARIGRQGAASKLKIYGKDYFKKLSALGVAKRAGLTIPEADAHIDKQADV